MQVRDLIDELKAFPEDWPVAHITDRGTIKPIEVCRSLGCLDPLGENVLNDAYNGGNRIFVGLRESPREFPPK